MLRPTMVSIKGRPYMTTGEYVFCDMYDESTTFTCCYDGIDVNLNIFVRGTRVTEVLNFVQGLLHEDSNFKEQLFREYSYLNPKEIRSITFTSTAGHKFVITSKSDIEELMKQYYRCFRCEVHDTDTENEIVLRERIKLAKFINQTA